MALVYLGAFVASLLSSLILTWFVRHVAVARGWAVSAPSARHLHNTPIPRLGGVGIYLAMWGVLATSGIVWRIVDHQVGLPLSLIAKIAVPSVLVFAVGLYDDFRDAGPYLKLAVQTLAAAMLFFNGLRVSSIGLLNEGQALPGWISLLLTVLWVLWITNAFNLLDGLDGLAAGSALFAMFVVLLLALDQNKSFVAYLSVVLIGSTLGFLRYNFNPATIFLGDSGSLFLGFMLSALALTGAGKGPTIISIAIPLVSFGLPILDVMLSVVRRFLSGRPLFHADNEHIHHKMLKRGLSHRQAVIALYAVSAVFAMTSLLLMYSVTGATALTLLIVGAVIWIGVQQLGYHELFELGRVARRTIDQKRVIINNLALRRASEALGLARDLDQVESIVVAAFALNDFDGVRFEPADARLRAFHWEKPGAPAEVSQWTMALDVAAAGQLCGQFIVRRALNDKPLLLDINLLTADFCPALGSALRRAVTPGSQPQRAKAAVAGSEYRVPSA
ncbi:MAG TPA: MraY family glycosyltransferase [Terriglobales bacterium]|nr:MraY family glycosyltransferase [Terriglobales bacterium]